mmetsp:Transcript_42095/g.51065  ORF Transcript_42095/g.51065 Transcript_42095/m.51065 type:complete len:1267 (-) Transcript_42095:505-4305(-)
MSSPHAHDAADLDDNEDDSGSDYPASASISLLEGQLDRFQVDVFCKAMQKQSGGKKISIFKKSPKGDKATQYTYEDMLTFQKEPIPTSLMKLSNDHATRAVRIFGLILKYMGEAGDPAPPSEQATIANKLLKEGLKRAELRDELYAQLTKQTRNNANLKSCIKAWELVHLVAATMPPSKDFVSYVSEYIHDCAHDSQQPQEVRALAHKAWSSLKRCAKAGPRRTLPVPEEIDALRLGRKLTTIVFFLDGTFEELVYDITTSVLEAVETLAGIIKLQNYHTFSLFEYRRYVVQKTAAGEVPTDEHIFLDDHRYIADVLSDFRVTKANSKEAVQSKLLFKKRMFRETDETVSEPMFINLSYVQAQHDYLQGNYPVGRDDAAQLGALQIQAEVGGVLKDNKEAMVTCVEKYVTKQVMLTRPTAEWLDDICERYKKLEQFSKEDARLQVLRILRSLPYGNSIFFVVKRIEDPIGLLPGRIILGINKRGIHFFRPVPKEYLHSAELRDIMQFGSSHSAVFFKMRVAGVLHIFQFETKQGEDICVALQTHINDVMMRRYSRAKANQEATPIAGAAGAAGADPKGRSGGDGKEGGGGGNMPGAMAFSNVQEQRVQELQKALEEANNKIGKIESEKENMAGQISHLRETLAEAHDKLNTEETKEAEVMAGAENLTKELTEVKAKLMDTELQLTKALDEREAALEASAAAAAEASSPAAKAEEKPRRSSKAGAAPAGPSSAKLTQLQKKIEDLQKDYNASSEKARSMEKVNKQLTKDKQLLENKVQRLEKAKTDEVSSANKKSAEELESVKKKLASRDAKVVELTEELASTTSLLQEKEEEFSQMQADSSELEKLREDREDYERREAQTSAIIKRQAEQIESLENLYREEQVLRKRYFNMMEDMKGKIRVFCRTRPLSKKDMEQRTDYALNFPDEFTVEHPWKDEKKPRSYQFDTCFGAQTSQMAVFEDTKYLVQSAVDGYNVCIFAYGQTGSGKTFTINGNQENPGLTPRAVTELFQVLRRDQNKFSFSVKTFMLELYQENLVDLLLPEKTKDKPKLEIKQESTSKWVSVTNATMLHSNSAEELQAVITKGLTRRKVAGTQMNVESSRSHLIVCTVIESTNLQTQVTVKGKLSFVDLAGSERVKKSGSSGEQLKEAQAINKSLSALGDVISALATDQQHIPYRNHKLTKLMSDSLGGNAKTLMFVNVSPAMTDLEETQNSLQYATRVRSIINDASKNVTTKEIKKLKDKIEYWKAQAGGGTGEDLDEIDDSRNK